VRRTNPKIRSSLLGRLPWALCQSMSTRHTHTPTLRLFSSFRRRIFMPLKDEDDDCLSEGSGSRPMGWKRHRAIWIQVTVMTSEGSAYMTKKSTTKNHLRNVPASIKPSPAPILLLIFASMSSKRSCTCIVCALHMRSHFAV
jgi:hypothetical protein